MFLIILSLLNLWAILYNQHDHVTHENYVKDMQMMPVFTNVANQLELLLHYNPQRMLRYEMLA